MASVGNLRHIRAQGACRAKLLGKGVKRAQPYPGFLRVLACNILDLPLVGNGP